MHRNVGDEAILLPVSEKTELLTLDAIGPGTPFTPADDQVTLDEFLQAELSTVRLKRVYNLLFLASNYRNISPLHHQAIKGRQIYVTERPDLHLVWHYERIFVKPIPKFLFSHGFWATYIADARSADGTPLRAEAEGFLRAYARLIGHESDLEVAKELKLVPTSTSWADWCMFIQPFRHLRAVDVTERYHYGEIRLTRLNFWHTLRYGSSYFRVHDNYASYFARFGAPYIFVFGAVTVFLTALQTGLATGAQENAFQSLSSRFVPLAMILTSAGLALLPLLFLAFQIQEVFLFFSGYRRLS